MDRKRPKREADKPRAAEGTPRPSPSTYLKDIPPFEAQLVVGGGFEVVLGDGFHAGAAAHGGAGAGKEALPEASAPPAARLPPRRRPRLSHTGRPGDDPP